MLEEPAAADEEAEDADEGREEEEEAAVEEVAVAVSAGRLVGTNSCCEPLLLLPLVLVLLLRAVMRSRPTSRSLTGSRCIKVGAGDDGDGMYTTAAERTEWEWEEAEVEEAVVAVETWWEVVEAVATAARLPNVRICLVEGETADNKPSPVDGKGASEGAAMDDATSTILALDSLIAAVAARRRCSRAMNGCEDGGSGDKGGWEDGCSTDGRMRMRPLEGREVLRWQ